MVRQKIKQYYKRCESCDELILKPYTGPARKICAKCKKKKNADARSVVERVLKSGSSRPDENILVAR